MKAGSAREAGRLRRHRRIRKKVTGSPERPRLVVHRSHLHLEAQIVDDLSSKILLGCSTRNLKFRKEYPKGGNVEAARRLGKQLGKIASTQGIKKVIFDRGGYRYHGRVKALADAVREQGLQL